MINTVIRVFFIKTEIAFLHFTIPVYIACAIPIAIGHCEISIVNPGNHNGMSAAVTDKIAYSDLIYFVMPLPVSGVNAK